jgi:hypothetical protein
MDISEYHVRAIEDRTEELAAEIRRARFPALELSYAWAVKKGLMFHGGVAINELARDSDKWIRGDSQPDYDTLVRGGSEKPVGSELKGLMFDIRAKLEDRGFKSWFTPAFHKGTYKLWAVLKGTNPKYEKQYSEVLDASVIPRSEFDALRELAAGEARFRRKGMLCAPSAYLKMSIHGAFSRPNGYVLRWKKLYPRLVALYSRFPSLSSSGRQPHKSGAGKQTRRSSSESNTKTKKLILDAAKERGWVVAGHEAVKRIIAAPYRDLPDPPRPTDLLVADLDEALDALQKLGLSVVVQIKPASIVLPTRSAVVRDSDCAVACEVYETADCTSYNESAGLRVGSPDIVLAILYANYISDPDRRPYYEKIVDSLVQHLERSTNRGLSRRFGAACSGN